MNKSRSVRFAALCLSALPLLALGIAPLQAAGQGISPLHKAAALAAAASARASSAKASDTEYEFQTFSVPGSTFTTAGGINDAGLVAGFWYDAANNIHGLLWRDHVLHKVDEPGFVGTALGGVNGAGIVVGNVTSSSGAISAVLYDVRRAQWRMLPDFQGMPQNYGNGINNAGVAVGEGCSSSGLECVGWSWDGERYSSFTVSGASPAAGGTAANGINDRGQVVGFYVDASSTAHGFLKDGDKFTSFDVLPSGTYASGINDRGEIVGFTYDAQGNVHGFIGKPGHFATFDFPGAIGTVLFTVNTRGDIGGWWADTSNVVHALVGYQD